MDLWVFSPKPIFEIHQGRSGKLLHFCGVSASLIARTKFGQDPSQFCLAKKTKIYNDANRHFLLCFLILRTH